MARPDEILKKTTEILSQDAATKRAQQEQYEKERRELVASVGKEIAQVIAPTLNQMIRAQEITTDMMRAMMREIKVEAPKIPEIKLPPINVPRPSVTVKAPTVNVPKVEVPPPQINFPSSMKVTMDEVSRNAPLPVMMMDAAGKPMSFSMGASGGKADFITIKNIIDSSGASIINSEGKLRVDASVSVGAVTVSQDFGSGEIGAETVRTVQATDAIASVNIVGDAVGIGGGTEYTDGDVDATPTGKAQGFLNGVGEVINIVSSTNALPVQPGTATLFKVEQVSGSNWSTEVTNTVTVDGSGVTQPISVADSLGVNQVSGATWSVSVTGVTTSIAVYNIDGDGNYRDAVSVESTDFDIRPLDVTQDEVLVHQVSGANWSTEVTNTVTVAPINVRGARSTAYATISADAETTLISGVSATYLDLVYVMGANQSDGAVTLDLATGTGGTTLMSLEIPANSTAGVAPATAVPMNEVAQPWVIRFADSDTTGTTVDVTGLFSQES